MNEVRVASEEKEFFNVWNIRNFLYLREGQKKKLKIRTLKIIFMILFGFVLFGQLLNSCSEPEIRIGSNTTFEVPTVIQPSEPIEFDKYKVTSDAQGMDAKKRAKTKEIVLQKMSVVSFSSADKIPAGTEANAQLSSGGSNGIVKAVLSENIMGESDMIAPKGSILLGSGQSSDERLYITFNKLIRPDKTQIKVKAQAFDAADRILGLKGEKSGDYAFKIAASSGLFFLSGMAEGMQSQSNIFAPQKPSMRDAALQGVAQATVEHGKKFIDSMNNKTVIEVKHSTPIVVIFDDGENQ